MSIIASWKEVLEETYGSFFTNFQEYLPKFLTVLLLLFIGWFIAIILEKITKKNNI